MTCHTGGLDARRGVQPFEQPPVEVGKLFPRVTARLRNDPDL
jgi:hypothetical protein